MSEEERDRLLTEAEEQIQGILLDLDNEHGLKVTGAEIDTRPFASYRVSLATDED